MADNPFRALRPSRNKVRSTPQGNAGYDNPRENIDPHVRTQALTTKEISGQTLVVNSIAANSIEASTAPWVKKTGDTMSGNLLPSPNVYPGPTGVDSLGASGNKWLNIYNDNIYASKYYSHLNANPIIRTAIGYAYLYYTMAPWPGQSVDLGRTSTKFRDVHMTGTLNGNNINCSGTISGADIIATNSISGANLAWDAAYVHSIDNSQAHSDYMLNTGDTASGDYNFDSNTLFVNSVNHKVGIGTVSPSERIHVYHATENVLARIESGDTDVWLAFEDSNTASANNVLVGAIGDSLVLRGGGTNTLYIDGSSNVGIGTASPGSALEVASGDVNITTGKLIQNTTTISATGPTDNVDVSGANILFVDNSSNAVTIGGFVGGVSGQVLQVVAINNNNNITLEYNEGTGNQDILLLSGADETLATRFGGWTLVCDGSSWYSVRFA